MSALNNYELAHWQKGEVLIGLDEAGRGPIAGPLVVAGVILPINYHNELIDDSKKLSFKKRALLFEEIKKVALFSEIMVVEPAEIDELNIYQATKMAMIKIAKNSKCANIYTDAMKLDLGETSLIKGDHLSISIAAASILAKHTRDLLMIGLDQQYPEYGFKNHKGYLTKAHSEAIKKLPILACYRRSYEPIKSLVRKSQA